MACHRCGARQDDPARGPSPWKRGVIASEQVLVCPHCQVGEWAAELDRCPACDGVRLSKALGLVRCSGCGWNGELPARTGAVPAADRTGLETDVGAALDRLFRNSSPVDGAPDR